MIIFSLLVILSLVGCIVLYKQLGPIPIQMSKKIKIEEDEDIKVQEKIDCKGCEECNGGFSHIYVRNL